MLKEKKNKKTFFKKFLFFFLFFFSGILLVNNALAAILYLEPKEGEYWKDDIFLVHLRIDTEGERINASQAQLTFPSDKLEVVEISQGNSIFSLWPEEPSFSNQEGKISFVGGVPLGFQGKGNIISIAFKVIFNQSEKNFAEIDFSQNSQVLLNNGLGTPAKLETQKAIFVLFGQKAKISKNEWLQELKKDNIPPEPFEIILTKDPLIFEGKYFIVFHTKDYQSGIDYYEVKEGKGNWKKTKYNFYLLEDQSLKSEIEIKAVDKKGNERISIL